VLSCSPQTGDSSITVAFDIRRLVDAHIQRQVHQGITRYTLRLYQQLSVRPEEIEVVPVYLHPLDPVRIGLDKTRQQVRALGALDRDLGLKIELPLARRRPGARLIGLLDRLEDVFGSLKRPRALLRLAQRKLLETCYLPRASCPLSADLFHSPVNPLPAPRRTPSPHRVLTVHDCIYLKRPELYPLRGRTPAIRKALDSLDLSRDHVICDSSSTRRDLLELVDLPGDQAHVVPLAADETFRHPDLAAGRHRLATLGIEPDRYLIALAQREKRKNIPRLVEAFRRSVASKEFDLLLVASSAYAPELEGSLAEVGLAGPPVRIATKVDDEALAGLLALATGFVYVPLYEGFGMPTLEAMAAGCPVVAADNSSIPEVTADAARYVDAEDVWSIADGLDELARDRALRDRLRARGLARAMRFSWRRTADETIDVYRLVLDRAAAASPITPC